MSVDPLPLSVRKENLFSHIDPGFINRRLCITALPEKIRSKYYEFSKSGGDQVAILSNDHLLITMILDVCEVCNVPSLLEAIGDRSPKKMFKSTERLTPCEGIYDLARVEHSVHLEFPVQKPISIAYHTEHLVSSTGKMTLSKGYQDGYLQSIVGLVHDRNREYLIEPLIIGAPWLDHQYNGHIPDRTHLMFYGGQYGEIYPEDFDQFEEMKSIVVESVEEWMTAMKRISEKEIKEHFADLLNEPTKKDWGGEENDHFSGSASVFGKRQTTAFLLKGPASFAEMTIAMCGKQGDQIYRLAKSGADISVIQHCHLVGTAVRETLRSSVVTPGRPRKFCIIDGQSTYKILKAYGKI